MFIRLAQTKQTNIFSRKVPPISGNGFLRPDFSSKFDKVILVENKTHL